MKRILIIMIMLLVSATASANAATYIVKKKDCLSKIAVNYHVKWPALYKANKQIIKNPDLIYPGQVLQIPEKGKAADSSVAKKPFFWDRMNGKPFGRHRDYKKGIRSFNDQLIAKEEIIAKIEAGESEDHVIKAGDRFEQMLSGNYEVKNNVVARFKHNKKKEFQAKKYCVTVGAEMFCVAQPDCFNWPWWSEIREIKPLPPPPPIVELEQPKPLMMMLLIPTQPQATQPPEVTPAVDECSISYESYAWAGHYAAFEGGGQSSYYGGKANVFLCQHETLWGTMREGVGFTINGWDGDNSGYNFRGDRWTIGPVIDLTTEKGSRFATTVQIGEQKDRGHDGQGYKAVQDTRILYLGQSADFYDVSEHIFKVESWLDASIDIGHDKESTWQGWSISQADDPAENKTNFSVGSRAYFWQTESYHGGLVGKGTYAVGGHTIGLEAGPFISDKEDIIKVGAGWRYQFNSAYENNNGNLIGIGMDLDIVKTIDKILRYLKTKNEDKEVIK